jgi:acetylornithine deacetylase/succinyl-diaminopimelate desuccinylase-like protein
VATTGIGYPEGNVHAPNENIVIENFVKGVEHTALLIEHFSRM